MSGLLGPDGKPFDAKNLFVNEEMENLKQWWDDWKTEGKVRIISTAPTYVSFKKEMMGEFTISDIVHSVSAENYAPGSSYHQDKPVHVNVPLEDVLECLRLARDKLMEDGWHQGSYHEGKRHCALGAIKITLSDMAYPHRDSLAEQATKYLVMAIPKDWKPSTEDTRMLANVPRFNDDPTTTFNDVIALFEDAMLLVKEKMANA